MIADRVDRTKVVGVTSALLAVFSAMSGVVQGLTGLLISRFGSGIAQGNLPAFNSLITDAVPISGRARAFSVFNSANTAALIIAPLAVGGIAELAGGSEGWRWAFYVPAVPLLLLSLYSLKLKDPGRGRFEREAVLGAAAAESEDAAPPQMGEAFARDHSHHYVTCAIIPRSPPRADRMPTLRNHPLPKCFATKENR